MGINIQNNNEASQALCKRSNNVQYTALTKNGHLYNKNHNMIFRNELKVISALTF